MELRIRLFCRPLKRLLLCLILCLPALPAAWADTGMEAAWQAPETQWLRDSSGQLTLDEVAARTASFQPVRGSLNLGHTRDVIWLRIVVPADLGNHDTWLKLPPPLTDDVRLYEPSPEGGWRERRSGYALPFNDREGHYRGTAFQLRPGEIPSTIYLRVQSNGIMVLTPQLWHADALKAEADAATLTAGVLFGLMMAIALINLVGWLITRQGVYGLFALFVACSAVRWAALDGLVAQYLFPYDATLPRMVDHMLLGAQSITGSLCQIRLLRLDERFPYLLRYYWLCGVLPGCLVMLTPWIGYFSELSTLQFFFLLLAPLVSIPAYLALWRTGEWSARLVAVALPVHFAVMCPASLANLGWLPFEPLYAYAARLAALPVILTLHLSIALQTREAERARDEARLQAAEARSDALRERQARAERERFLAMIAHEVRTPVAVIETAAHSLRQLDRRPGDPAMRTGRYENIERAVQRMRTLMELTETEDRLHGGDLAIAAVPLDFADVSRAVLDSLEPAAAARVTLAASAVPPGLQGDHRLLYFALLNLIDNALKYAHPGSPICIDIAAEADASARPGVRWRIRDHGVGIPTDQAQAIFDKYRRLDESTGQPGLGLGLALARDIAHLHAGQLELDPTWEHGACFVLWLPLTR